MTSNYHYPCKSGSPDFDLIDYYIIEDDNDVNDETHKCMHKYQYHQLMTEKSVHSEELIPKKIIETYDDTTYRRISQANDAFPSISSKLSAPITTPEIIEEEQPKSYGRMDWTNYHRLSDIHSFMDDLECDYPSICTTGVIGNSIEGRDIKILRISNSDVSNASVWMDAGIHAREWIAPAVATYVADYIAKNFKILPSSITNKDWYFLPVVNPDGYEYSHTQDRMWRKNRAWHGGKCVGIDLNRNFSYGWGYKGSSDVPSNAFFRGPEPFSEPESSAIKNFILGAGIQFKVYITLHSYGQVIIFPYAYREEICTDYIRLLEGATVMSKAIYKTNGNTYKVGISSDVMYPAAGTSNDWSYGAAGIPFCYLIELRSKKHKFKLPKEEIEETGTEILNCVKALMEFVDNYSCLWKTNDEKETSEMFQGVTINIWKEEHSTMDIMVEGSRAAQVAGMLHEREIPYSIAMGDVRAMMEQQQGAAISKTILRNSAGYRLSMDWTSYHRLDVIYAFLDDLSNEYPYLCSVIVIGQSYEGRDIKMLKISNGNIGNTGVWLDGAIHPREWISTAVVTFIADKLVRTFNVMPDSVTNKDWYILPVMNPDGYEYTHTHDRMWRKNRARYGECIGVDLNRNFSYGWGEKGEEGSSEDPGNIFFRGSKPFSEPETLAVRRAVLEAQTTFKVFLSFHSYGEVVIFPWGYTGEACPDYVDLLEGGTAIVKGIYGTNRHTYKVGSTKDLMYYAAGTSIDWSYAVANIPFSYMIELRGKKYRFLLPKDKIVPTATEVLNGVMRLMDFVDEKSNP